MLRVLILPIEQDLVATLLVLIIGLSWFLLSAFGVDDDIVTFDGTVSLDSDRVDAEVERHPSAFIGSLARMGTSFRLFVGSKCFFLRVCGETNTLELELLLSRDVSDVDAACCCPIAESVASSSSSIITSSLSTTREVPLRFIRDRSKRGRPPYWSNMDSGADSVRRCDG